MSSMVMKGMIGQNEFNAGLVCTREPGTELKASAVEFEFGPVHMMVPIETWDKLIAKIQTERDAFSATGKF